MINNFGRGITVKFQQNESLFVDQSDMFEALVFIIILGLYRYCIIEALNYLGLSNYRTIHPLVLDVNYINLKNQVIKGERRILKELGFCVHVKHPHKVS